MPRVLLTFTGFHDPFSIGLLAGRSSQGPSLRSHEIQFDRVVLFSTPGTVSHSGSTQEAVGNARLRPQIVIDKSLYVKACPFCSRSQVVARMEVTPESLIFSTQYRGTSVVLGNSIYERSATAPPVFRSSTPTTRGC
jgi:hypothetical protein